MDKNSVIGLVIIGLLVIGYSMYMQPSEQEIALMKHQRDSVEAVHKAEFESAQKIQQQEQEKAVIHDSLAANDLLRSENLRQQLDVFAPAGEGKEEFLSMENDLFKINFSTRGGKVHSVELKNYKDYLGKPVVLLQDDSSVFELKLSVNNRIISTNNLYFTPVVSSVTRGNTEVKIVTMRLSAGTNRFIEYIYSLGEKDYTLSYQLRLENMNGLLPENATNFELDWKQHLLRKEHTIDNERAASTIYYRFTDEEVDYLSYSGDNQESLKTKIKWIAFKQQFFTSVLIAGDAFESPTRIETQANEASDSVLKYMSAELTLPFSQKSDERFNMMFYIGPNHYQTLKKLDLGLEHQIQLGWGIFGYVNRFLVIPIFNFLNRLDLNFGIIILILTIIIRILLLPLTYTSFLSQAKMKVLKPEVDEINAKYPDDAMKKQQEQMALYRRAGVNPLGGCIPGLLQMPILIAMFNFFPSSIELRHESFLWAHDLSSYDSILDLPFKIPFYGDHVSLFTLLMTASTLLFTKLNMQMTAASNPQMKWMMYLMPVMFLGIFNNYSAGLSYYYFLSNMFGLGQQYMFKFFIDEDAIHRKLQENKKRPAKQEKSGFQKRLEKMAKERGIKPR
ncbi:MAG: membrane protein insertase YidC [Bacteroidia bacterium]|nr:membrane protein insertase YidC [Bacteroidia bacterium]